MHMCRCNPATVGLSDPPLHNQVSFEHHPLTQNRHCLAYNRQDAGHTVIKEGDFIREPLHDADTMH